MSKSTLNIPYKSRTPEYQREWRKLKRGAEAKPKCPWKLLKQRYGITKEEYERLLVDQNNSCAISDTEDPGRGQRLHVDHNHLTGEIRGLLCDKCNRGLGYFKDNFNLLLKASNYLDKVNE